MSDAANCVLYVDDDELSLMVMNMLLVDQMNLPYLFTFNDSSHFMERVEELPHKPDVIFLDIHVKPRSGFEMLRLLREGSFADTPIIAMTASVMNEEVEQLKEAGFDGVIAKPINLDRFPDVWYRLLNGEVIWDIT